VGVNAASTEPTPPAIGERRSTESVTRHAWFQRVVDAAAEVRRLISA
jgi:hypothetical protein